MGLAVRRCRLPLELALGLFLCLCIAVGVCIEKLCTELGRLVEGTYSPRSELGVWLPIALRAFDGESRTGICILATLDRLEFTLLERRDDIEGRLAL
jgi:hypothetical protein